jgi:translation initiation factor IF-3
VRICSFKSRRERAISKDLRINDHIRARDVRLISQTGEQLGILQLRDALRIAHQVNLDLVEVAPTARPPVCKIMDYGRFKYEQAKRDREARKNQKIVEIKELKMRPTIEEHDFSVKLRNARRFLEDGDKVKASITFRGREIVHADLGRQVLERLVRELADLGAPERPPRMEGRFMTMMIQPKPGVGLRPATKTEQEPVQV